jgi:hypothetical protein
MYIPACTHSFISTQISSPFVTVIPKYLILSHFRKIYYQVLSSSSTSVGFFRVNSENWKLKWSFHLLLDLRRAALMMEAGIKMAVFWVAAPCSLVEVCQRFRGPCYLHHQGDRPHLRTHRRENLKSYCGRYRWYLSISPHVITTLRPISTSSPL